MKDEKQKTIAQSTEDSGKGTPADAPDAGAQATEGATESSLPARTEAMDLTAKDDAKSSAKKDHAADKASEALKIMVAETKFMLAKLVKKVRKRPGDKLIMVPVDFSDPSTDALIFAAELADSLSAPLLVLHVVHDPGEMPGYYAKLVKKKRVDRIQDVAQEVFNEFLKTAINENPKLKSLRSATNLLVMGLPVTRILQLAEKLEPFLVVMGSQGRTGLKHLFLGSKAEQVVQLCHVPVTIVKQDRK